MPILDETPLAEKVRHANLVLKSRPRDLEDTLAQLVHDEDPVIAASAIHFAGQRGLWSLADDLEYVLAHRPAERTPAMADVVRTLAGWVRHKTAHRAASTQARTADLAAPA